MKQFRLLTLLALLMTAATGAWAQEQSETIATTAKTVQGTHFTISNNNQYADGDGMRANSGITVTPKNGETITKVVITCNFYANVVSDGNTSVSSGTKEITNSGGTITVTGVNATTFTFTCTDDRPLFKQFVVYYTAPVTYSVKMKDATQAEAANWTIASGSKSVKGSVADGLTGVAEGDAVTLQYNGRLKVKGVKATSDAAPAAGKTVDLSTLKADYEAQNGDVLTGVTTSYKVTIAAGATVTLDGVTISSGDYCIKCLGDATIILKDGSTNTLTGTGMNYPALSIGDANTTLTIQGSTGALNATSAQNCAGIGGGYKNADRTCGNIRIEGGVITAQGGGYGAGIGTDYCEAYCGDIIITGGTITANGGGRAAGIGTGAGDGGPAVCGAITIANTVTKVTATKGENASHSIGKGYGGKASCGTVTIGGTVYWQNNAAVGDGATYLAQATIEYPASN